MYIFTCVLVVDVVVVVFVFVFSTVTLKCLLMMNFFGTSSLFMDHLYAPVRLCLSKNTQQANMHHFGWSYCIFFFFYQCKSLCACVRQKIKQSMHLFETLRSKKETMKITIDWISVANFKRTL